MTQLSKPSIRRDFTSCLKLSVGSSSSGYAYRCRLVNPLGLNEKLTFGCFIWCIALKDLDILRVSISSNEFILWLAGSIRLNSLIIFGEQPPFHNYQVKCWGSFDGYFITNVEYIYFVTYLMSYEAVNTDMWCCEIISNKSLVASQIRNILNSKNIFY